MASIHEHMPSKALLTRVDVDPMLVPIIQLAYGSGCIELGLYDSHSVFQLFANNSVPRLNLQALI